MKLTSHEEYGLRCLIRLGREGLGGRLTIPEISNAEGVSEAYVGKLLRMLRLGGFVTAARGTGGYSLARPASQIALGDVMAVLGGRLFESDFCETHSGQMKDCVNSVDCSLRVLWRTVQAAVDDVLGRTTLHDLLSNEQQMITWVKGFGEFASHSSRQISMRPTAKDNQ
jgi:Rrf2 family transcriptional regulator, iron-sulfur cluster assembly transcription factor